MNKELIQQRFGKKLNLYNENAKVQKRMAENLFQMLSEEEIISSRKILELGCGTGLLTKIVSDKTDFDLYKAIDIVNDCEKYIQSINSNICFINEDMEKYIRFDNEKYDLIISNAAIQWAEDFYKFIKLLTNILNPNGILLFTTFGKENFREIHYTLGKTLPYYSKNELLNAFSEYNLKIEEEICITSFKTPKDVLKHIQNTGVNALENNSWTKADLKNFESAYTNLCNNHPTLTYNPLYIKISMRNRLVG